MNNWMNGIDGLRQMNSIVLPGSHDSGMVKGLMNRGGLATIANACTQILTIKEQLEAGVRWLDIRIDKSLRCFHSAALGEGLDSVAEGIISFLDENPTEVVIVLLTKSDSSAYTTFLKKLHGLCSRYPAPVYPLGHDNQVARISLNSLRGRVVVAMDKPPVSDANYRIVRALLKKYDAEKTFKPENLGVFSPEEAGNKYDFVLNSAGSYSDANFVTSVMSGQRSRAEKLLAASGESFMSVYYTTNTSPIGLRSSSIESADTTMWQQLHYDNWFDVAIKANRRGEPLFNCVMMDFASVPRCTLVRARASALGW